MGEYSITNIMKLSIASTSLKESEKKVYESLCKKTTIRKLKKAKIVSSEHIADVTGPRGICDYLYSYRQYSCCTITVIQ